MADATVGVGVKRVAVLDDYQGVAASFADWRGGLPRAEVVFFRDHVSGPAALAERLRGFDSVIAMRERTAFTREVFGALPDLRLLVTTGMRNAAIDLAAAREAGVTVMGTESPRWAAAELTWALILALARHIPAEDATVRAGGWQVSVGTYLSGRTLGIVGLGRLGGKVAEVGRAFGMEVVAWSPHLTAERAAERGARFLPKLDLFRAADVVTVHMVLAASTRGLVGEPELRAMRPSAFLVNTSRGPLVDEAALIRALTEGWIAGAGLDVFDQEPLPADHPLRTAPRTVLTPHVGYVTDESYRVFYTQALEDIQAFARGERIREL